MGGKRRESLDQLDLFGAGLNGSARSPTLERPAAPPIKPAKPSIVRPAEIRPRTKPTVKVPPIKPVASDEWWTTQMVCAFLKISRKTLWERRRNATLDFPRPVNLGGGRNVYRASEVRAWAETMAIAELCDLG